MATAYSFDCIKNMVLKSDFNNWEIIDLILIIIENLITITERRVLSSTLLLV